MAKRKNNGKESAESKHDRIVKAIMDLGQDEGYSIEEWAEILVGSGASLCKGRKAFAKLSEQLAAEVFTKPMKLGPAKRMGAPKEPEKPTKAKPLTSCPVCGSKKIVPKKKGGYWCHGCRINVAMLPKPAPSRSVRKAKEEE